MTKAVLLKSLPCRAVRRKVAKVNRPELAMRNIVLAILVVCVLTLVIVLVSSSVRFPRGGGASGSFVAYFNDLVDGQRIALGIPTVIFHNRNKIEITPQHRYGDNDQVIRYSVTVTFGGEWDLREDNDFRALLLNHITPVPSEIYGIGLYDLKYSQRQFDRRETIRDFWDFLWSRPSCGYSIEEVRQLMPVEYADRLDVNVTSNRTFVFDWPHDERSLILTFIYEDDKQAVLLQGYSLGYSEERYKMQSTADAGDGQSL